MDPSKGIKPLSTEGDSTQHKLAFGYPDYWTKIHSQFEKQLGSIHELFILCDQALREAENRAVEPLQNIVCFLTRSTMAGASEATILCGNGCGAGAMKIVRGMYESRWTAEYLRRNPDELQDYLEFGKLIGWDRVRFARRHSPSRITEEVGRQAEDRFNEAKGRFTRPNGEVRQKWSKKQIRQIAKDIGCEREYDLPYAIASSIHHANFEGLLTNFDFTNEEAVPAPPPSLAWIERALLAAHGNLYHAVDTLNNCCNLDLQQKIDGARQKYIEVWSSRGLKAED